MKYENKLTDYEVIIILNTYAVGSGKVLYSL